LLEYLESKELLLVLDNYEHLLPDVTLLRDLLARAPGLVILVTSRQRLGLTAEWVYDLSGLDYPVEPSTEALESYSAAQLFRQRALQVEQNFTFSDGDGPAVIRICKLAEGMPLAIELAASSVRYYSCAQIADQLKRDARVLSTALGDVPERHHSLYTAFEHS